MRFVRRAIADGGLSAPSSRGGMAYMRIVAPGRDRADGSDGIGPNDDAEQGSTAGRKSRNPADYENAEDRGLREAMCASAAHGSTKCAANHNSPPIKPSPRGRMRGSRRRASASIENPNATAPCRIKVDAPLQAPSAMPAAMPPAP